MGAGECEDIGGVQFGDKEIVKACFFGSAFELKSVGLLFGKADLAGEFREIVLYLLIAGRFGDIENTVFAGDIKTVGEPQIFGGEGL